MKKDLAVRTTAIVSAVRNLLLERKVRVERMDTALQALSPLAILDRGYALVFDASGKLLKDAARVKAGDEISARLAKGTVSATVKKGQG
jgi:exodeoxyribonuclease VII large subunit